MAIIGAGLEALGAAIVGVATAAAFIAISLILCITILIYTNKINYKEIIELIKNNKRWR